MRPYAAYQSTKSLTQAVYPADEQQVYPPEIDEEIRPFFVFLVFSTPPLLLRILPYGSSQFLLKCVEHVYFLFSLVFFCIRLIRLVLQLKSLPFSRTLAPFVCPQVAQRQGQYVGWLIHKAYGRPKK